MLLASALDSLLPHSLRFLCAKTSDCDMDSVRSSTDARAMGGQDDEGGGRARQSVVVDKHDNQGPRKRGEQPGLECDDHDRSQSPLLIPHIHPDEEQVMLGMEESSQGPSTTKPSRVPLSQQPLPEYLASLGIKVRDFAYENTLSPIIPVPRIPRQVQPEPLPRKRNVRGWDDENSRRGESSSQSVKPNSQRLERKATEPLDKESLDYAENLEQAPFRTMHSLTRLIVQTSTQSTLSWQGLTSTYAPSPSLSHEASQESELVQTPSPMKLVADDASILVASQSPTPDIMSCVPLPQPLPASFSPASSPPAPSSSFSVPDDLFVESQPASTPSKRRRTKRVGNATPEAPSPSRYQLRRRASTRSRRPQPYPVTSTVAKKNSLPRSRRACQR
ncbi:hypothetical protein J3A83DRAFT_4225497 [Scleroderma citrinum]